jgi:hypothetical protein
MNDLEAQFPHSTTLSRACYHPEHRTLDVWFKTGAPYRLMQVERVEFDTLAQEGGSYYQRVLRLTHPTPTLCVKLQCGGCRQPLDPGAPDLRIVKDKAQALKAYHASCARKPPAAVADYIDVPAQPGPQPKQKRVELVKRRLAEGVSQRQIAREAYPGVRLETAYSRLRAFIRDNRL